MYKIDTMKIFRENFFIFAYSPFRLFLRNHDSNTNPHSPWVHATCRCSGSPLLHQFIIFSKILNFFYSCSEVTRSQKMPRAHWSWNKIAIRHCPICIRKIFNALGYFAGEQRRHQKWSFPFADMSTHFSSVAGNDFLFKSEKELPSRTQPMQLDIQFIYRQVSHGDPWACCSKN